MSAGASTLEHLVNRCGQLYSLPVVAMRVLKLTESPTVDVRQIKECIENDPAMTSKILRVVNSSLFGLSREVTDLNQALALLGINPLKLLVLGFSLPDQLFIGINGDILRRYWHRTLVKAVAAREISQTILRLAGDEAFIAGLLQDIGMLVLLQEVGASYSRFLDGAFSKAPSVNESEQQSLGFGHVTLSARLLERWKLPGPLVRAIEAGQSRQQIEALPPMDRPLPQVLLVSEMLASVLAENRTDLLAELLDRGREYFALSHMQLNSLVSGLSTKVDHLAEVLQLELPPGNNYQAILLGAHERLSVVASDVAGQLLRQNAGAVPSEPDEELLADVERLAKATRRATSAPRTHLAAAASAAGAPLAASSRGSPPVSPRIAGDDAHEHQSDPSASHARASISRARPRPSEASADPGLAGRVTAAVATCRQARRSLSLLVVEINHFDDLLISAGPAAAQELVEQVGAECRRIDHEGAIVVQSRDVQFAVILPDCDRRQAVDVSNDLLARLRRAAPSSAHGPASALMSINVGVASVALPPKNFPAEELIRAAERCLNGARLAGGNAVKSIEIY
jgi:HD-like signal output (HDOD) protein/GGDEF domain-containing protein